jgi:ATP-dependent 26S proteasome regulatory subunit
MFELQMPSDAGEQRQLDPRMHAIYQVGARAPSSEQKFALFRELNTEEREAAVRGVLQRMTDLASTAEELNSVNLGLREMIENLTWQPWHVAMFKSWENASDQRLARVLSGGEERLVAVSPEVDATALGIGETVFLSAERNALVGHGASRSFSGGQLGEICDVLENGDLMVSEHDQQVTLERAHWLPERDVSTGDSVIWCPRSRVVLDAIPAATIPGVKDLTRELQGPPPPFAGYDDLRSGAIDGFVSSMRHPEIAARYGLSPAQGALLLYGSPGQGKTLLARTLAHELGARFFVIDASSIYSPWVGESERHLIDAFRRAREAAPAVLFIDEIDAIGRVRGASTQQHADRVASALLTNMEGASGDAGIAVVGACNREDLLDPALRSRFGRQFQIPPPGRRALREVAEVHFTADLPYRTPATRGQCIDALVHRLTSPNGDNEIATIRFRDSKTRTVSSRDLVSGRAVKQIAEAACESASLREIAHGVTGIKLADVNLAVEDAITRWRSLLSRGNVAQYIPDLPEDVDVVAVDPVESVSRPARYLTDGEAS